MELGGKKTERSNYDFISDEARWRVSLGMCSLSPFSCDADGFPVLSQQDYMLAVAVWSDYRVPSLLNRIM